MTQSGDINQDGRLDAKDIALLKSLIESEPQLRQHLSAEEFALLDINRDGQIDQDDLTALYGKLLNASTPETSSKLAAFRHKLKTHE